MSLERLFSQGLLLTRRCKKPTYKYLTNPFSLTFSLDLESEIVARLNENMNSTASVQSTAKFPKMK